MYAKPLTPMIKQYLQIKSQHPDALLFFRLGDFYEMFFEDARIGSRELDIALTSRDKGEKDSVPLCGVPYYTAESYISKLLQKGYKVALCDQVEDPKLAKGIVKREVVRVFTPGLATDAIHLGTGENNFLMGFCAEGEVFGVAFLDISTGEFKACQISGFEPFLTEALRNEPKEILSFQDFQEHPSFKKFKKHFENSLISYRDDSTSSLVQSPAGDRMDAVYQKAPLAIRAVGLVLRYAEENQKKVVSNICPVSLYQVQDFMVLDELTKRNLELTQSLFEQSKRNSLFGVLDETMTPMGSRRLKQWINYPLVDVREIERRLEGVSDAKERKLERGRLREFLRGIQDVERLTSRIYLGHANARDLVGLKDSLQKIPGLIAALQSFVAPIIRKLTSEMDDSSDLCQLLESSIAENPPPSLREGGIIKPNMTGNWTT